MASTQHRHRPRVLVTAASGLVIAAASLGVAAPPALAAASVSGFGGGFIGVPQSITMSEICPEAPLTFRAKYFDGTIVSAPPVTADDSGTATVNWTPSKLGYIGEVSVESSCAPVIISNLALQITPVDTVTTISAPGTSRVGQQTKITVTVQSNSPSTYAPTGSVAVTDAKGVTLNQLGLTPGPGAGESSATYWWTPAAAGQYIIQATYLPGSSNAGASVSAQDSIQAVGGASTRPIRGCAIKPRTTCVNANLQGANLANVNLRGANLQGANLSGANLSGANLAGANLSRANLQGANLEAYGANAVSTNLQGANLNRANLSSAQLLGANMTGANLSFANVRGADFTSVQFRNANLTKADFRQTNLSNVTSGGVIFNEPEASEGGNMTVYGGYIFSEGVILDNVDLTTVLKPGLYIPSLANASLQHTILRGVNLANVNLNNASLNHADVSHTNLSNANLAGATIAFANLNYSNLTGANLNGADLNQTSLSFANDASVADWTNAICPSGVIAAGSPPTCIGS